ncbi:MAG: beta-propeller domain-containing protein [Thaumarchaeota archaeon]|nr:beta-propeller domain-containing protein [Nitrososphaerota archaeon]
MQRRTVAVVGIIVLSVMLMQAVSFALIQTPNHKDTSKRLLSFNSYDQLDSYVLEGIRSYNQYYGDASGGVKATLSASVPAPASLTAASFTTTNVQVAGVDELDKVKTDGSYLYVASNDNVFIVSAGPEGRANIVAKLSFAGSVNGIFVSGDRLAVIGTTSSVVPLGAKAYPHYNYPQMALTLYDISDRSNPVQLKVLTIDGGYVSSRLTGGYIYLVAQENAVVYSDQNGMNVTAPAVTEDGILQKLQAPDIYYQPSSAGNFNEYTIILSVHISDGVSNEKAILTGYGSTIYASLSNIYLTFPSYSIFYPPILRPVGLPASSGSAPISGGVAMMPVFGFYNSNTTIFRVAFSNGGINVAASGTVEGSLLNQFSMDEYGGYFRVATTLNVRNGQSIIQTNNVYVLDSNLNQVGSLLGLAPKEKIYAVRFMENRAYVVTFEKIDPLFAVSLDDPTQPHVLSALSMPGFSDYLNPIGGGYIIGVGKEAQPAATGNFAWYQGLKISLYHVDANGNATEVAKVDLGDRGSDSPVLNDHRAFVYDSTTKIVALPVLIDKVDKSNYQGTLPPYAYGQPVWQGAYLYTVSSQNSFHLVGRITHIPLGESIQQESNLYVDRIVIIGNAVYTISNGMIMANSLPSLSEVSSVALS